jgi:hypothetical protein
MEAKWSRLEKSGTRQDSDGGDVMRWISLVLVATIGLASCSNDSDGTFGNLPPLTMDDQAPSVARIWNEVLLYAIGNDNARPVVHARNLWHVSAAMYDAWAAYDDTSSTWLLGRTQNEYDCAFSPSAMPRDRQLAREQAISFAAYRLIMHRFERSPGFALVTARANETMEQLGYDPAMTTTADSLGSPAALGNHVADCYIAYGMGDGANEAGNYANLVYQPRNPPIEPEKPGNNPDDPLSVNLDYWQPIKLTVSIDQSGNVVSSAPPFVGAEWGGVHPFSLTDAEKTTCSRAGFDFPMYYDPGPPAGYQGTLSAEYKWTHSLVSIWSSQLDPTQGRGAELVDISPASLGNIAVESLPVTLEEHRDFYDLFLGDTTQNQGYDFNPATGEPYEPQLVPLGDYARVLAEYWADGPNSVTPPGHWFDIANHVNDHPMLVRRLEGVGPIVGPLEWDVKMYFALGGAMHDVAISIWGIKGCYDSARPVSAIRGMAERGQSSDINLPSYHPDGIPLVPGYIELVESGDPLADDPGTPEADDHVGKVKLYAWRGPDYINNPNFDTAGVGWILAENWWPYQRPTFVSPPFAGYLSGHSTFSRAGAELLALFTGDEFFPGGMSEFHAPMNQFLVFEDGPSVDVVFEWAKYTDASDQCSLSRIWGGIHPPMDDIQGRLIGMEIGPQAFYHARDLFTGAY